MVIKDFSLEAIIKGCLDSEDMKSPECRLLRRISDGDDVPEYPEYNPEKQYYIQIGDKVLGPTAPFLYEKMGDLIEEYVKTYNEYPSDIWTD